MCKDYRVGVPISVYVLVTTELLGSNVITPYRSSVVTGLLQKYVPAILIWYASHLHKVTILS